MMDNYKNPRTDQVMHGETPASLSLSVGTRCRSCAFFAERSRSISNNATGSPGRCRRHSPTLRGWPIVYSLDWCGDHKHDEGKL